MNAIKLPVRCYQRHETDNIWAIRDAENTLIASDLDEPHAHQISLALNCHDALVEALGCYGGGGLDGGKCARAALANVE